MQENPILALMLTLSLLKLELEQPSQPTAVELIFDVGKTNTQGKPTYGIFIRHKDVDICPVGGM